jgi:hypothetical protein
VWRVEQEGAITFDAPDCFVVGNGVYELPLNSAGVWSIRMSI